MGFSPGETHHRSRSLTSAGSEPPSRGSGPAVASGHGFVTPMPVRLQSDDAWNPDGAAGVSAA